MPHLEQAYLKFLHEKPRTLPQKWVMGFLQFLSFFYLAGWAARKTAYRGGLLRRKRLACPVISVGNLTTGGTGKTPVVIALARHFCAEGKRVAVLSRGYGRSKKAPARLWVSDGRKILAGPEEGGDEPVLIAQKAPQAAVLVGKDRYRSGLEALEKFQPDLFILDDGYQRRFEFHRDLDILVVDGINPFSTGWVLPAGLLREPLGALSEADIFVLNKVNLSRSPEDIRTVLGKHNPRAYVVESRYVPLKLRNFLTGQEVKPGSLDRVPVGIFSGVGNPLSVVRTLADDKIFVRHAYHFPDHFAYTREKIGEMLADAKLRGLKYLVTTEKDEVKLPRDLGDEVPILVLEIQWEVSGGKAQWETVLKTISLASSKT
ncbi:MAG TPA: tetraacyldisaccharide 4'-kinase [bacterium]|nr:tetraacyldisaccharide 4'-kinase [bacterium]